MLKNFLARGYIIGKYRISYRKKFSIEKKNFFGIKILV